MPEPWTRGAAGGTLTQGAKARTEQVGVRLPTSLLKRLDQYVATLRTRMPPGVHVTRADGMRALLERGLDAEAAPRFTTPWVP